MIDSRPQFDFDDPTSQDPIPEFPFPRNEKSQARQVAWLIFSRLYVKQINNFMCCAPKGFRDELEVNYGFICTKFTKYHVMFELTDDYPMPRPIQSTDWLAIHENRALVKSMLVRAASLYYGTMESITMDEAMTIATALGMEGVGKLIPLKMDE